MDKSFFDKFNNMPVEDIMKVGEIHLVEPLDSKRKNQEEFDFTFSINTLTDSEWRVIFKKNYGSEKVDFQGMELVLTCTPKDLGSEITRLKISIVSTNEDYQRERQSLIAAIHAKKERERISAINRNVEDDDVSKMFKDFKL